ncbi:MAG: thiamine pyrophosphate-binding protein [Dehalococcoidales bacterium]
MKLTGGEIIAEYLIKEGIPYMIGIPGHGCLGLVDAFKGKEEEIKVLQVRHEQSAVHLADGYYRFSGKPLAVFTSIGPGAVNTAVGVATCYVDSTPVLVISGETHTYMFGRGVLQEIERTHDANFPRMLEPVVKR